MLRLGEARKKPHAPPRLWVIAFLVTVALPIYILSLLLSPGAGRGELRGKFTSLRGLAAASPFPAPWKQVANPPDAVQLRPGNSCPLTLATCEATAAEEKRDSKPAATVKVASPPAQS